MTAGLAEQQQACSASRAELQSMTCVLDRCGLVSPCVTPACAVTLGCGRFAVMQARVPFPDGR